jgi:hypothetical protein
MTSCGGSNASTTGGAPMMRSRCVLFFARPALPGRKPRALSSQKLDRLRLARGDAPRRTESRDPAARPTWKVGGRAGLGNERRAATDGRSPDRLGRGSGCVLCPARLHRHRLGVNRTTKRRRLTRDRTLRAEFAAQTFGGVVEKQANFGGEIPPFRMHDVNRGGRRLVFDENGLQ